MPYSAETPYFGLPYRQDGDISSGAEEERAWAPLDATLQGVIDAVGVGAISGGIGTMVAGEVVISALKAIVPDDLGGVYVEAEETTEDGAWFGSDGAWYVHCQLTETSRQDRTCVYYRDESEIPAADAILLMQVTVAGGIVTEVDNSVRALPAIAARLPVDQLIRIFGSAELFWDWLGDRLGAAYMGETPPDDIDARLTAMESGGGGGGGGTVYWGGLQKASGDPTTIDQEIDAKIVEYGSEHCQGGGGGGGATPVDVPWDCAAVNDLKARLKAIRTVDPEAASTQINSIYVVADVWGDGTGGSPDWTDRVNSTWLP